MPSYQLNCHKLIRLSTIVLIISTLSSCWGTTTQDTSTSPIFTVDSITKTDTIGSSDCVHRLTLAYIKDNEALNHLVYNEIFGDSLSTLPPQELANYFYTFYRQNVLELDSSTETDVPNTLHSAEQRLHYEGQLNQTISFSWTMSLQSDDTQEWKHTELMTFDTEQKRKISENDLFIDGYEEGLTEVIQTKLMQSYKVHTLEDLVHEGFFTPKEIQPNGNFMLTSSGIKYIFNTDEIASHLLGQIVLELNWDDVSHLIRPGSLVEQYI